MNNLPTLAEDRQLMVAQALREDIRNGDITAELIRANKSCRAQVISREDAVICGVDWVNETFHQLDSDLEINWHVNDSDRVKPNQQLFEVSGSARSILTAERTALNFLQLLSGTATLAASYASAVDGTSTRILDTRKTIPGLRTAQKYAVHCGGCKNHRIGLYDAFLIKENHIAACGSIEIAISTARANHPNHPIEVEVESLAELEQALAANADIVMLDNFSLLQMEQAVLLNRAHPNNAKLEASGNMSLESLKAVAETGVDYISSGALTKNVRSIDLSMRIDED